MAVAATAAEEDGVLRLLLLPWILFRIAAPPTVRVCWPLALVALLAAAMGAIFTSPAVWKLSERTLGEAWPSPLLKLWLLTLLLLLLVLVCVATGTPCKDGRRPVLVGGGDDGGAGEAADAGAVAGLALKNKPLLLLLLLLLEPFSGDRLPC